MYISLIEKHIYKIDNLQYVLIGFNRNTKWMQARYIIISITKFQLLILIKLNNAHMKNRISKLIF